jgi:hypothetical protein
LLLLLPGLEWCFFFLLLAYTHDDEWQEEENCPTEPCRGHFPRRTSITTTHWCCDDHASVLVHHHHDEAVSRDDERLLLLTVVPPRCLDPAAWY